MLPTTEAELRAAIRDAVDSAISGTKAELKEVRAAKATLEAQIADINGKLDNAEKEKKRIADEKAKADLLSGDKIDKEKVEEMLLKQQSAFNESIAELTKDKDAAISKNREMMIDGKIRSLADNAVNPDQVVTLITNAYEFSVDGEMVKVNKLDGTPMLDKTGAAVTVAGAYETFMAENLHMLKPGTKDGGSDTIISRQTLDDGSSGEINKQIDAAIEAGDLHKVVKLKMQRDTANGPHSMREQPLGT